MVQVRVTEPNDAIRTIENETHPCATMGPKRMRIERGVHGARINRDGAGPATLYAANNDSILIADIDPSLVERMTGIRPSTWPEVAEKARLARARVAAQYEPMSPEYQTTVAICDGIAAFVERQMTADRAQHSLHLSKRN